MTTREKITALAKPCDQGFTGNPGDPLGESLIGFEAVEAFYHAVRAEALEDAANKCMKIRSNWIYCSSAIRKMKCSKLS